MGNLPVDRDCDLPFRDDTEPFFLSPFLTMKYSLCSSYLLLLLDLDLLLILELPLLGWCWVAVPLLLLGLPRYRIEGILVLESKYSFDLGDFNRSESFFFETLEVLDFDLEDLTFLFLLLESIL